MRPHRWQPTRLPRPWDSPGKNTGVGCHFLLQCMKVKSEREVAQSCPTLSNPMDCSPPGFSVHGIFQARVLEWGATAFSDQSAYYYNSLPVPWDMPFKTPNIFYTVKKKLSITQKLRKFTTMLSYLYVMPYILFFLFFCKSRFFLFSESKLLTHELQILFFLLWALIHWIIFFIFTVSKLFFSKLIIIKQFEFCSICSI